MSRMATYDGDGSLADRIADRPLVLRPRRLFHLFDKGVAQVRDGGVVMRVLAILLICAAPAAVASAEDSPVAIVVLPPRFISGGSEQAMAAAELACDRLARELQSNASLRVVDRTQLDRVLNERGLDGNTRRPLLSYDMLAWLEIDAVRPIPKLYLKLIDLSHGDGLAAAEFTWSAPVPDAAFRDMTKTCLEAARDMAAGKQKALRVRVLEVQNPGKSARLEPLAARLRETFTAAIARSKGVRLVHHLEAATAKEESLLLTLGLSRLGGGRQFSPQSDATVEFRIRELDGVGKTFEQTPVEVAWRVRRGADGSGDWVTAEAQVKNFDGLLKTAWARCAEALGRAAPQAAGDYLDEMALRRKQAKAELDAAPEGVNLPRDKAQQRLDRIAAAAKLDPTWEQPAFLMIRATAEAERDGIEHDLEARGRAIREASRYLARFNSHLTHRQDAVKFAMFCAFDRFLKLRNGDHLPTMSTDDLSTLDMLKEIVELSVSEPRLVAGALGSTAAGLVYRGMTAAEVSLSERKAWLEAMIGNADARAVDSGPVQKGQTDIRRSLEYTRLCYRELAIGLMLAEGDITSAKQYVEYLLPLLGKVREPAGNPSLAYLVGRHVRQMDDAELLDRFNALTATEKPIYQISIRWPQFFPWEAKPDHNPLKVKVRTLRFEQATGAAPLAAIGQALYVLIPGTDWSRFAGRSSSSTSAERIGIVRLDARGRPTGNIELLPNQPQTRSPLQVISVAVNKGKLYLGTLESGLLEYDPAERAWRVTGPDNGLPAWSVHTVMSLADDRLFCAGGYRQTMGYICTVIPSKGEVRLVHRVSDNKTFFLPIRVDPAWASDGTIRGFAHGSSSSFLAVSEGNLHWKSWPMPEAEPWGWKPASPCPLPTSIATVGGRRFLMAPGTLRDVDDDGKVLRTWTQGGHIQANRSSFLGLALPSQAVELPNDLPLLDNLRYDRIVQDNSYVFLLDDQMLCFDPDADTWYGPLELDGHDGTVQFAANGTSGVWLQCGRDLVYLDTADFIVVAKKAGRVITGEEFHRKRQEAIDASPPLERAKWALSMRQFDKARQLCAAVLDKEPCNVETLLVMALLHESCCLNRPDKAMEYYGRLATMEDNPSAAFTGLVHQYRLHINAKRYADALRIGKLIEQRYPRNSVSETIGRHNRRLQDQAEGNSK